MKYIKTFNESVEDIKFIKQPKKKGAKTDTYNVSKDGVIVGRVKWSSRMRGYAFLPTSDIEVDVKEFINNLMSKRRELKKRLKESLTTDQLEEEFLRLSDDGYIIRIERVEDFVVGEYMDDVWLVNISGHKIINKESIKDDIGVIRDNLSYLGYEIVENSNRIGGNTYSIYKSGRKKATIQDVIKAKGIEGYEIINNDKIKFSISEYDIVDNIFGTEERDNINYDKLFKEIDSIGFGSINRTGNKYYVTVNIDEFNTLVSIESEYLHSGDPLEYYYLEFLNHNVYFSAEDVY